jgi:membrane peptidoglycan carboxypeptidase
VRYEDLPLQLVHAILSAEDKRFFDHGGFDFIRIVGAAWADIRRSSSHYQGASTITMQVARTFFFSNERHLVMSRSPCYSRGQFFFDDSF